MIIISISLITVLLTCTQAHFVQLEHINNSIFDQFDTAMQFDLNQDLKQQISSLTGHSLDYFDHVSVSVSVGSTTRQVYLKTTFFGPPDTVQETTEYQFEFKNINDPSPAFDIAEQFKMDERFVIIVWPRELNGCRANQLELKPFRSDHGLTLSFYVRDSGLNYRYRFPSNFYLLLVKKAASPRVRRLSTNNNSKM